MGSLLDGLLDGMLDLAAGGGGWLDARAQRNLVAHMKGIVKVGATDQVDGID